jgi:cellulose synthase/poly-beta-1,6-N-acetylglucosamine synthase-like glycosyltransferase
LKFYEIKMIDIIITSYKEPKSTLRAVKAFLGQKVSKDFRIIVCDPFKEVRDFLKENIQDKRVGFFLDPGEGKSYALNLLLEKLPGNKDDIFIFTDGDVYVSQNAVSEILKQFEDSEIGCVTGHPVPIDSKDTKFGYWSHLLFDGVHRVRKNLSESKTFFECSGYLFAIRKGIINDFPLDASEDSVIPYLFWQKGYKIGYAENAEVYVKNPENMDDWFNQKVRNIKGHENLSKLFPEMPRTKSFWNEIKYGAFFSLTYPRSFKQFGWTIQLYKARLGIYKKAFSDLNEKEEYRDGWREKETATTRTLD